MKKGVQDEVAGMARQSKGKVKQEVGRISRNRSLQAEGFVEKNAGKAQKTAGRVRRKMGE